jgi:hypothetical protein
MKYIYEALRQKEFEVSRLEQEVDALRVRDIRVGADRASEISSELLRLYNQQAEFFRMGVRVTPEELREYEKRRGRVRELFAELSQLRTSNVA